MLFGALVETVADVAAVVFFELPLLLFVAGFFAFFFALVFAFEFAILASL
jgi:hypothetical protein